MPAPCQAKKLPTRGGCGVLVGIPSTCTRAYPSMLPAGVLLTHLYMVPSYTSTLLMRSVPFSEISNRESCPEGGSGAEMTLSPALGSDLASGTPDAPYTHTMPQIDTALLRPTWRTETSCSDISLRDISLVTAPKAQGWLPARWLETTSCAPIHQQDGDGARNMARVGVTGTLGLAARQETAAAEEGAEQGPSRSAHE